MKYERLMERDKCVSFNRACFEIIEAIQRLAELEDKIERGELVEVPKGAVVLTPEERAEEMRLCNEERKQAVKEFVCKVLQIGSKRPLCLFNEYKEGYIDCLDQIKELAAKYGVEVEE